MIEPVFKQQLLSEAIYIGDHLLSTAERHTHGIYWKTVFQVDGVDHWVEEKNIYNGVSGIVLFLIELYKHTNEKKYIQAAAEGMDWVLFQVATNSRPTQNALLTGYMSVPFTLLSLYRVTGSTDYLEEAKRIVQAVEKDLSEAPVFEFLNGLSGSILGLLHLYNVCSETWILGLIDSYLGTLIDHVQHGEIGVYWDRSPFNSRGLCGFSHGAAGIGFVLLELGYYFQNNALFWLAEQAFLYESQFFSSEQANWADFRTLLFKENAVADFENAYQSRNLSFFTAGGFKNTWCHGAAGIGLSRLRAYELLRKPMYKIEAKLAIETTRHTTLEENRLSSFTLCHGAGGNAELFLEAYRVLKNEDYYAWACEVAKRAFSTRKKAGFYKSGSTDGEDASLFMGSAGIGYFYLRLLSPHTTSSILAPHLQNYSNKDSLLSYSNISISLPNLVKRILRPIYKEVFYILENKQTTIIDNYFLSSFHIETIHLKQNWEAFVTIELGRLTVNKSKILKDAFHLASLKNRIEATVSSNTLLHFKNTRKIAQAKVICSLNVCDFDQQELVIDSNIFITYTSWDWISTTPSQWLLNYQIKPDEYIVLLIPTPTGVISKLSTPFAYLIINSFSTPTLVKEAAQKILSSLELTSGEEEQQALVLIYDQIRQAVSSGLLLDPKNHPFDVPEFKYVR